MTRHLAITVEHRTFVEDQAWSCDRAFEAGAGEDFDPFAGANLAVNRAGDGDFRRGYPGSHQGTLRDHDLISTNFAFGFTFDQGRSLEIELAGYFRAFANMGLVSAFVNRGHRTHYLPVIFDFEQNNDRKRRGVQCEP